MQLVLWAPPARPDSKVPLVHKDQKEILAQAALRELRAQLGRQDLPAPLDRPGRKALRDLLARREGFLAGRNFKTVARSSCLLESTA